ncbi:hypothetical protein J6590_013645 [Homalodisca vitripennis]|nr:hypothetical protein J6590_013645 [Homalodisca vitripennis]
MSPDENLGPDMDKAIGYMRIHLYYMWVVYSFYLDIRDRSMERDPPEVSSSGVREHAIQDDDCDNRQRLDSLENQSETSIFIVKTSKPSTQPRDQEYTDINI